MQTLRERLRRLGVAAKLAEEQAADARAARDDAIEQADQDGMSIRQIAVDVDMSPARVQRIIIERTAARQAALRRVAGL